ncbi:MAG: PilN domain-containing protein [Gammaproteobacteria bacterium]
MAHEIDLIPTEYRRANWMRGWVRKMVVASVLIVTLPLLAFAALTERVGQLRIEVLLLEKKQAVTAQQRSELEMLDSKKDALTKQLSMLSSLRSGAPARSVFVAIDAALQDADVWFLGWQFQRAGVMVPESQASGVETGYFIVVPESSQSGQREAWMVETHMTINGQASDHEALSQFVNGLYAQPTVVDVKVQKTELSRRGTQDVVEFDIAVVLNSEARG